MLELIDQHRRVASDEEGGIGSDGVTCGEVVEINDLAAEGSGECRKQGRLPDCTWAVQDDDRLGGHPLADHLVQPALYDLRQDLRHGPKIA